MLKNYINKVLAILGGFKDQNEYNLAAESLSMGLTPVQAAQRIINQR